MKHTTRPEFRRLPRFGSRDSRLDGLVLALLIGLISLVRPGQSLAQQLPDSTHADQRIADAWWTGPMLAASPGSLPPGHILLEPYFFDVRTAHGSSFGNLTYALIGVAHRLTAGAIINDGWNRPDVGPSSSGLGFGDLTLQASYQLTQFQRGSWVPTTSVVVQETLPTGKFDRLGNRPSDGLGSGAYTTAVGFYAQSYYWLPNHRILRARVNLTQGFSNTVGLEDVSVYGTSNGFRGTAKPGAFFSGIVAAEYSITKNWVIGLDLQFNHNWSTRLSGYDSSDPGGVQDPPSILVNTGPRHSFAAAPAIEYNFTSAVGVLFGTRLIPSNDKTTSSVTPAIAINIVH